MSRAREIRDFIVHLRWHYQVLILPAGYLLGGLFQPHLNFERFAIQFLNIHLLLNGGVTAYNSYWDKDEGPIGGLARPPPMKPWMHAAALAVQLLGAAIAYPLGPIYLAIYATTMILSIFYSRPRPRWKGHPVLSLVAVGVGTGTNTFLLGYLAAGDRPLDANILLAALGVASTLLSLYPISQIYQLEADQKHGDRTFAMAFGLKTVKRFYLAAFIFGTVLITAALSARDRPLAIVFAVLSAIGCGGISVLLARLKGEPSEYKPVMRLKYFASLLFSAFVTAALIFMHTTMALSP